MNHDDKILVTGATGLVGSALVNELQQHGYTNVVGISSVDVDLTDQCSTDRAIKAISPTIVFHIAARVYGLMGNLANLGRVFTDNVRMNTNVIDSATQAGTTKIIAMGSAAIYSDDVPLPMRETDVWNGPPHSSEGPYAQAKRAMLAQLEAYEQVSGLDWVYTVSTNLYGPNDRFDEQWGHVVPSLISKMRRAVHEGQPFHVWGSGSPTRDLLYSLDAARALRLAAESGHGVYNFATGESHTISEIVGLLCEISGFDGEVIWDASKPDGQRARSYDVSRLQSLGFEPAYSVEEGLRATYEWFCDNVDTARR